MYSYHNRIKQRIRNGELIGIEKSRDERYTYVFIFSTPPYTRPIRPRAVARYIDILNSHEIIPSTQKGSTGDSNPQGDA